MIDQRPIGTQGLTASAQGLGCMGMSEFYGEGDDEESIATIHRALELGVNFLDTAAMYGAGKNEQLVGRAIADRRDEVVLATKFGIVRGEDPSERSINGRPEYVKQSADESLRRLGLDHIDLFYQHRVDPDTPIEETVGAMGELAEAGKIRFLGLSEAAPDTIRRAHDTYPITALQTEYSLWTRHVEDELLALVRELGIGFVAYSPLGRGFLTGRFKSADALEDNDFRRYNARFSGENLDANVALVEKVEEIAAEKEVEPGQLALAWVHAQGEDIFPIPGTKRRTYLEQNAAAFEIELDEDDLARLDEAVPAGAAAGERYPSDPEA
jgi:aryl-alcohol dehydrogenase-like predicted oxidoreductase